MKIRINEVRYDKTFNLGDYQNEKIGLSASMEDGQEIGVEDAARVIRALRKAIWEGSESSDRQKKLGKGK